MGAEVIKVERPELGDETRHWGPPWLSDRQGRETSQSAYYVAVNRGKQSIAIDLSKDAGVQLVKKLIRSVDILIENFKVGDLARKGLGYDDCAAINPKLIYCSITGFGQSGPMAEMPGYDYLVQGQGGLMSITGIPDGDPGAGPQRVGVAVSDLTTGMNAAIGILGALHHRNKTGEGQYIDLALLDVQVSWLANQAQNYLCSGEVPSRTGISHPNLAPYQPFATSDGSIIIAIGNDAQFRRLCDALNLAALATDPCYSTNPRRVTNRETLAKALQSVIEQKTSDQWLHLLRKHRLPCGPVQTIADAFSDPQVLARDMLVDIEHPEFGPVKTVASPIKYSLTKLEYDKAPPTLGQDTVDVLSRLVEVSAEEIDVLKCSKVVA